MKFFTTSKAITTLIAACIFSVMLASQASASMTWLSSITKTDVPARIALDAKGNIYVTEPRGLNRLLVFNPQGNLLRTLRGLREPVGVAVDAKSRIYIGNAESGSVDIYNPDFTLAFSLGSGKGEFKLPSSLAVTSAGVCYVVDADANVVKVYDSAGALSTSFGSWGRGNGFFNNPLAIAIDETQNELYVTDRGIYDDPSYGAMGGARVQVFDLSGKFLRSFGQFGSGQGQMKKPEGIATDGTNLYISDPNLAAVHVFTTTGSWMETISDSVHVLKTPIGIAIGKDKRLFVASSNGSSIEVYGLPGFTTMSVDSKTLNFTAVEGAGNPGSQTVNITNSGSTILDWTAKTATADGKTWLAATSSGSVDATAPSAVTVSVLSANAGLGAGQYTGTVTLTGSTGIEETIAVNLTVAAPPAILAVDRTAVSFKAQYKGTDPLPQLLNIRNAGTGPMAWSAVTSAPWLQLNPSTATNTLTMTASSAGLQPGVYSGIITITASGAQASPMAVSVSLQVVSEGTLKVSSNLSNASFDISGQASFTGTGASWKSDVAPGDYTVTFKRVAGYLKPASKSVTIVTGQEIVVIGEYRKKPVLTHILAGSAHGEAQISILAIAGGTAPRTFTPFTGADASVRVAAGDLDLTGVNAIVTTDYKRSVKVFSELGTALASYDLPDGFNHADVTVGDIDGDGKADILIAAENQTARTIKVLSYSANVLQEKASLFSEDKTGKFSIALGDVNGDGALEVLIADANSVRAFSVKAAGTGLSLAPFWSKSVNYSDGTQIAAGDLNGDGSAEVIVSYDHARENRGRGRDKDTSSLVSVLKGLTGEDYGLTIEPFKDLGFERPCTLSVGDIDGDGVDEIIAGAGPAQNNDPVIRAFESDGTYAGITMKPMNGKSGVNVGLGSF